MGALDTRLTERLGCKYPIVQTAMGWVAHPELVAGSCNAGAFGFLAGATIPPEEMERDILRVKELTDRPFGRAHGCPVVMTSHDAAREFSSAGQ